MGDRGIHPSLVCLVEADNTSAPDATDGSYITQGVRQSK